MVLILAIVSTPLGRVNAFIGYTGLIFWVIALSRIPIFIAPKRAALVLPFAILAGAALPFSAGGATVDIFDGAINLSIHGIELLTGVTIKSFLAALTMTTFIATTPFEEALDGARRLKAPRMALEIIALTRRYIHLALDEARSIRRAMRARGYKPRSLKDIGAIGRLVGHLFLRAHRRGEKIFDAIRLRSPDGVFMLNARSKAPLRRVDLIATPIVIALIAIVRFYF